MVRTVDAKRTSRAGCAHGDPAPARERRGRGARRGRACSHDRAHERIRAGRDDGEGQDDRLGICGRVPASSRTAPRGSAQPPAAFTTRLRLHRAATHSVRQPDPQWRGARPAGPHSGIVRRAETDREITVGASTRAGSTARSRSLTGSEPARISRSAGRSRPAQGRGHIGACRVRGDDRQDGQPD